jgi:ubiquinone/menaquinone biosynthesis C-methylase UbiE
MSESTLNPVYDASIAYQRTAALIAAVKLDIFTTIGARTMTVQDLAMRTGASERGLRILCDFLTVMNLLTKHDGAYMQNAAAKILLDGASPFAMGSIVDFVAAPEMIALLLDDPAAYVKRGRSEGLANLAPDHPVWVRFAKSMIPLAMATAARVAGFVKALPTAPSTVLDVAAGHGLYGIEVAKALPGATITAVDSAGVLEVARTNAVSAGVSGRYRTLGGSAFEADWGQNYDLILLANFLHHFDHPTCVSLLRKIKRSLSASGLVVGVEFVPNEDRISPPVQATFAFWMLASTPGGDAYTTSDLDQMAREAGFAGATTRPLPPTPQSLVIFQ